MVTREQVEQLLRLNGLSAKAPDDEIKSLLISAQWHENDVETALVVLRENPESHEQHISSLHKVFTTDAHLQPEALSQLLGIEINVKELSPTSIQKAKNRSRFSELLTIFAYSALIAIIGLVSVMWFMKVGVFHEFALQ